MEVSDSAMSEESTSTASSSNGPCDDKSVCQVCFVKGNKLHIIFLYLLLYVLFSVNSIMLITCFYILKLQNVKRGTSTMGLYAVMDAEHFFEGPIRHQEPQNSYAKA